MFVTLLHSTQNTKREKHETTTKKTQALQITSNIINRNYSIRNSEIIYFRYRLENNKNDHDCRSH